MTPRAIFFDLDYTLYDQRRYVTRALARVAAELAGEFPDSSERPFRSLVRIWRTLGPDHDRLFDTWLAAHDLLSPARVHTCVATFHAYCPRRLPAYRGVDTMLRALKRRHRLGLVTDGEPNMQRAKVAALGLSGLFDAIVYAGELPRAKPNAEVFRRALEVLDVEAEESLFIGDHPVRDIMGARRVGMEAVRVLTGAFRDLPDEPGWRPNYRLRNLRALSAVLRF